MRIIFENVSAGYEREKNILHDLSFIIEEGSSVSIIGPNGAGKTTLLKVMAGILPYNGSICFEKDGTVYELSALSRKQLSRLIALMPQFSQIYFSYTVRETVMFGRYVHMESRLGIPSPEDNHVVDQILALTGLTEIAAQPISNLSGGQQQRVFLARTFAQGTPFILLDEPTNHLDLRVQQDLFTLTAAWQKQKTDDIRNTMIGVFHNLNAALISADHLLFLKEGRKAAYGKKEDILSSKLLQNIYGMDVAAEMKREYQIWNNLK